MENSFNTSFVHRKMPISFAGKLPNVTKYPYGSHFYAWLQKSPDVYKKAESEQYSLLTSILAAVNAPKVKKAMQKKFLEMNLLFTHFVAQKEFGKKRGLYKDLCLDDVVQEANIALIESIKKFDFTSDTDFKNYLMTSIKRAVGDFCRSNFSVARVPKHTLEKLYFLRSREREFFERHGRIPSMEELQAETGLSSRVIKRLQEINTKSVELDEDIATSHVFAHNHTPEQSAESSEISSVLNNLAKGFSEREKQIYDLYLQDLSEQEIAERLGLLRSSVNRTIQDIVQKTKIRFIDDKVLDTASLVGGKLPTPDMSAILNKIGLKGLVENDREFTNLIKADFEKLSAFERMILTLKHNSNNEIMNDLLQSKLLIHADRIQKTENNALTQMRYSVLEKYIQAVQNNPELAVISILDKHVQKFLISNNVMQSNSAEQLRDVLMLQERINNLALNQKLILKIKSAIEFECSEREMAKILSMSSSGYRKAHTNLIKNLKKD